MAALDNDHLVVRVVYTGPPLAGKTQSVRALMPLLKGKGAESAVMSPGEWRGRTAFFDFADYVGGAYEGKPIRCQILSTPGQIALSDRRELLLRAADAVIMVVASQPEALERAIQCYEEMEPWLADAGRDVPIRMILQCNKQDLPDAIPSDDIGRILGLPCGKDVYATSARTGKGLRAAFVAGVRNAVERARGLVARGVPLDTVEIESGEELFERMRREVAPLGSLQPPGPSARLPMPAQRAASPAAPSAERKLVTSPARSASAGSMGSTPSTAGAPASARTTAPGRRAASGTTAASGVAVPRPAPSEPAPAGGAHAAGREVRNPEMSPLPPSASGRPAPRGARQPAVKGRRVRVPSWRPLKEEGPAASAGRNERADGARGAVASSARASSGTAGGGARGATSKAPGKRVDIATVHAPAPREAEPASSARRAITVPPARSLPPAEPVPSVELPGIDSAEALGDATLQRSIGFLDPAGEAARAWHPGSGPRPSVMPASAYHARLPRSSEPGSGAELQPAGSAPAGGPSLRPTNAWLTRRPRRDVQSPPVARPVQLRAPVVAPVIDPSRYVAGGVRPAVMPAVAYFAALKAAGLSEPRRAQTSLALTATPDAGATSPLVVSNALLEPAAGSEAQRAAEARASIAALRSDSSVPPTHASRQAALEDAAVVSRRSVRPAVMPASAYVASLEARGEGELALDVRDAPGRDPVAEGGRAPAPSQREPTSTTRSRATRSASARPAVMPASAFFAELALEGASASGRDGLAVGRTPSAAPDVIEAPSARGRLDDSAADGRASAESASGPEPAAGPDPEGEARLSPLADHRRRPAVMPASAYFAALAAGAVMPTRATPSAGAPAASVDQATAGAALLDHARPGAAPAPEAEPRTKGASGPSESPAQHGRRSRRSSRPAVMPARALRSAPLNRPESSLPEWAAPRLTARGSNALREPSEPTGDAAPAGRTKSGAMPALRLVRGGTAQRRSDEPTSGASRSALTLLPRPAVMPASAWRASPPEVVAPLTVAPAAGRDPASRPAVMPASAWRQALAAAEEEPRGAARAPSLLDPAASPSGASSSHAAPPQLASWEVAPPDAESWEMEPPEAIFAKEAPSDATSSAAPGYEASVAAPDRYRLTRASTHGLEFSPLPLFEEPSESFRIPETPPGLQVFIAASRRALFPYPATEHGSDERNEHEPASRPVGTTSESPPGSLTLAERAAAGGPGEPTTAPHVNPCVEPSPARSDHLHHPEVERESEPGGDGDGERFDSLRAMSGEPPAPEHETPPFSFPGPRLPGQARMPRAVWPRTCWRTLETQLTAYAAALSDARGRWIGELAPGWFARTLRKAPDERCARRAFAEQVLRERKLARYLSRPRCVVLTEEADGLWIWQVACRVPTLATILRPRLGAGQSASDIAGALLDAALGYLDAQQRFVETRVPLPLSPHALSFQDGQIVYSGLMPDPGAVFVEPAGSGYAAFQEALRKMWPDAPVDARAVLGELQVKAAGRLPEPLLEIIQSVVGQR